jgi:hypothetical protein
MTAARGSGEKRTFAVRAVKRKRTLLDKAACVRDDPFASMNGTLRFRRSASIAMASSLLAVAGCGVEMGGLFDGDGVEAGRPDARGDASSTSDRTLDVPVDVAADRSSTDGTALDGATNDSTIGPMLDGDGTRDARFDFDARIDTSIGADAVVEASPDADAMRDVSVEGDVASDLGSDPTQDVVAEDTAAEPRLDVAIDPSVDAVADADADAVPDASMDKADAEPPGTCFGGCNTFANIGQTITRTVEQGAPPTMTGGTILDGTYVAIDVVHYNGDTTPFSISETSIIAGNYDAWVSSTNGQPEVRYTTTFTTTNNQIAFTVCCPAFFNFSISYATDGITLSHVDTGNPNRVITYLRR